MTYTPEQARFIGVAIATAMNEMDISLTLPSAEGVVRPNPEPSAPAKKKRTSTKKKDPLAPRKSQSKTAKPKRRSPKENSRIVHEVNGYLGMAKKAKTQAGARIWLLKATKATPSGWTATHNQIARKHALHCPDIAA